MPRPSALTPSQLLNTLTTEPAKPGALAKRLAVSRATLHRKLEPLIAEGLVQRVGEGPTAAYRLATPEEAQARALAMRPDGLTRLVLDKRTTWAVRESLELYTRLGIGQLEEIRQEVSMRHSGDRVPFEKLDRLDEMVAAFKRITTGMSSNASFGIYNPRVPEHITKAWALMRAIRHRLAWDQTPEGSLGTWHDEPLLDQDTLPGLSVLSDTPGDDGTPTRYVLELPREAVALIGRAAKVALRVRIHDFRVLVEMVEDGTLKHAELETLAPADLAAAAGVADSMSRLLSQADADNNVSLSPSEARLLHIIKACEAFGASPDKVSTAFEDAGLIELSMVSDSVIAFTLDAMPPGMLLNFKAGKYRVIAPRGDEGLLTIIAESQSLQTAVQMARNEAKGVPARRPSFG